MINSTDSQLIESASKRFFKEFGKVPAVAVFAPGRVNLIGEHTDYNDGFVLPFALPFKTLILGSRSSRSCSRIVSCNIENPLDQLVEFSIDSSISKGSPVWANYVKGTIFYYLKDLPADANSDAVIISNVPLGSGLSSSASLEVATATLLEKLFELIVSGVEKALRCQKAEHNFADTPCGIMDQYISSMGEDGKLLLIDCRSNDYKLINLGGDANDPDRPVVLVTNSNVKHTLSGSEYPDRVKQCRRAVESIQKSKPEVRALRDATMQDLEAAKHDMPIEAFNRARHCIGEDRRTLATIEALEIGDYGSVGHFMLQSHVSLRDDFEVSCPELDLLVELAMEVDGVYGSRMTGGGFGGCTVTLVKKSAVSRLREYLKTHYKAKIGRDCDFYEVVPSAGSGVINLRDVEVDARQQQSSWSTFLSSWGLPVAVGALAVSVAFHMLRKR